MRCVGVVSEGMKRYNHVSTLVQASLLIVFFTVANGQSGPVGLHRHGILLVLRVNLAMNLAGWGREAKYYLIHDHC